MPETALEYEAQLAKLYSKQAQIAEDDYLHAHSRNRAVIRRHVAIFRLYQNLLKDALKDDHTILDWGCRHAADACMIRMLCGPAVQLHGCDVDDVAYPVFFDFARLKYSKLTHPYLLPYADDSFDLVIGSGVLEHVPNDSESLKELYRVIRRGGHFVMTFLPNKYSYVEWLNRQLKNPGHSRLYSMAEARHMFWHHGFRPIASGYHQIVPTLSGLGGVFDLPSANRLVERLSVLNPGLERLWPINKLATNIFVIGKKEQSFHG
jgi:SAM-dependent methyltransferase